MLSCGGIHGILHIIFSFVRVRSFSVVGYVNRGGGGGFHSLNYITVQYKNLKSVHIMMLMYSALDERVYKMLLLVYKYTAYHIYRISLIVILCIVTILTSWCGLQ